MESGGERNLHRELRTKDEEAVALTSSVLDTQREERGRQIFRKGTEIRRIDQVHYYVSSQSGNGNYYVVRTSLGWACNCPDRVYRGLTCKHIYAVEFSLKIRGVVQYQTLAPTEPTGECLFCCSRHLVKDGVRHNKAGDIQKFNCLDCHHYFTVNLGFERMKHNPKAITSAMQLYFSGESLRSTQRSLRLLGTEVSHQTVHNWITKYVGLMERYLDRITPQVSETWRADELFFKVKGDTKYLYALMDDETRFWIAQEVADTKYVHDARDLLRTAKERAGKVPQTFITDGAQNYMKAWRKEYWAHTPDGEKRVHLREITLAGKIHNNKMERMNGEIRDREKTMRGVKSVDSPIL
jgi:putative transposase